MKKLRPVKINAFLFAKMLAYYKEGDLAIDEVAEQTGLHISTVRNYTNELHRAGVVHIVQWKRDAGGRPSRRVFMLGGGKDAKRPTQTRAEIARRYKERYKQRVKLKEANEFLYGESTRWTNHIS